MDDSPAGGLQPGEVPPEPCHSPGTGRPLPDLIAIRLAEVPDSWPPYDDEVAIAGAGQAMRPEGRSGGMGGQRRNRATPRLDGGNRRLGAETGGQGGRGGRGSSAERRAREGRDGQDSDGTGTRRDRDSDGDATGTATGTG